MMLGAYDWALRQPLRKLRYNMAITALSIVVAFGVGGVEAFGLIADRLGAKTGIWKA